MRIEDFDELFNFKTEIDKLNSNLKEKNFIIERTNEYLFILENQNALKDQKINDIVLSCDENIEKIKKESKIRIDKLNEEKFIFSIIISIYNAERYLSEAINSIINQNFIFDNVEIILVDDGSTDNCKNICEEYAKKYPNNIKYIYQEHQGLFAARNNGLKVARGNFINFLDSDDKLEPQTLNEIFYHFNKFGEEIDVIAIPMCKFDSSNEQMPFFNKYNPSRIVDIITEFDFLIVSVNSSFLRRSVVSNFKVNCEIIFSEDSHYINRLILEKGKFGVVDSIKYLYREHIENDSFVINKVDKKYFNQCMELYFKELINYSIEKFGEVIKYIQQVLMHDLKRLFLQNTNVGILSGDELKEFHIHLHDVFQVIDDEIILSQDFSKFLKYHMLNIKHDYPDLSIKNDLIWIGEISFEKLSDNKIAIIEVSKLKNNFILRGNFKFYSKEIKINAKYNNEELDVIIKDVEEEISFSQIIAHMFNFEINLGPYEDFENIRFEMEFHSKKYHISCINKILKN